MTGINKNNLHHLCVVSYYVKMIVLKNLSRRLLLIKLANKIEKIKKLTFLRNMLNPATTIGKLTYVIGGSTIIGGGWVITSFLLGRDVFGRKLLVTTIKNLGAVVIPTVVDIGIESQKNVIVNKLICLAIEYSETLAIGYGVNKVVTATRSLGLSRNTTILLDLMLNASIHSSLLKNGNLKTIKNEASDFSKFKKGPDLS